MNDLKGKVAVVTGASQGIGRAIAAKLSSRGAQLVLVDLHRADDTAAMLTQPSMTIEADVSSLEEWLRLANDVGAQFGRADIVVNNAGIYPMATIDDLDADLWDKTMAINLNAHFYSAKAFVPLMRRHQWGRFINVSSNSIGVPVTGLSHYMASKMGVIGFVRGLANDVAEDGITVNAILPAITNTPGTSAFPDDFKAHIWQGQAIKRLAEPEDIAAPVAFLASDDSAFITGQAIVIDGGQYKIS
ncbi:SDR family NAD(P)-dependent oxidoreductase [Kineobactrum salinum]|uniref:SDR family oxidoreductase n=1 Tax=Kineobactrum salinum TaxID=2708301 RepID=A0A6C0U3Q5_9GAMM|nr:SDR family NAD(P)-dependent oxidoreductase [Kineobactrum salinum]QIB66802.1 SDR family oxidoreductase [Kineobactrum salinum]